MMIIFDLDTIEQSSSGSVSSVIYWEIDGYAFPEKGWYDFVVVLLTAWLNKLQELKAMSSGGSTRFFFMEGPFEVHCEREGENVCVTFLERTIRDNKIEASYTIPLECLSKALFSCGKTVLESCRRLNIANDDARELKKLLTPLGGINILM